MPICVYFLRGIREIDIYPRFRARTNGQIDRQKNGILKYFLTMLESFKKV